MESMKSRLKYLVKILLLVVFSIFPINALIRQVENWDTNPQPRKRP